MKCTNILLLSHYRPVNLEKRIKKVAYDHGIKTQAVYDVLAIVLRDVIIEKLEEGAGLDTTE